MEIIFSYCNLKSLKMDRNAQKNDSDTSGLGGFGSSVLSNNGLETNILGTSGRGISGPGNNGPGTNNSGPHQEARLKSPSPL